MSDEALAGDCVFAVSDLHIDHPGNKNLVDRLVPRSPGDWLVVGGDVSENIDDFSHAMDALDGRFAKSSGCLVTTTFGRLREMRGHHAASHATASSLRRADLRV